MKCHDEEEDKRTRKAVRLALVELREKANLTVREAAKASGVDEKDIDMVENEGGYLPLYDLKELARVYQVSIGSLLETIRSKMDAT